MKDDIETLRKFLTSEINNGAPEECGIYDALHAFENVEAQLAKQQAYLAQKARFEWNDNQIQQVEAERDALRSALDRAKEILSLLKTWIPLGDYDEAVVSNFPGHTMKRLKSIRKNELELFLFELSADAPAQPQISDDVCSLLDEAIAALGPVEAIVQHDISIDETDFDDFTPMTRYNLVPRLKVGDMRRLAKVCEDITKLRAARNG
jgi:hypothetical protein